MTNKNFSVATEDTTYIPRLIDYQYSDQADPSLRNILIFNLPIKYLVNKKYTFTVDTTFVDIHGLKLNKPYVFTYTPEPQFRVYSYFPTTSDVNPLYGTSIKLDLNSSVDSFFLSNVQISPSIKGNWSYGYNYNGNSKIYDSTYIFYNTSDTLLYDTKYTISIPAEAKDSKGHLINAPYQFSFTTQPFQINFSSSSSYTGPGGFTVYDHFYFTCNGNIDTSTIRSSISITPTLPFGASFYSYNQNCREFYLNPDIQKMQRGTTYTITINTTLRSRNGAYLKQPYSYSFTTGS